MNKYILFVKRLLHYVMTSPQMRIVRYLMVGLTNMSVCFTFMYIGAYLGLHYLQYTVLGYGVAIVYSFYMNLKFTFRVSGNITKRLILFFLINFSNLGIVELIEYEMITVYHFNHYFSIFCAMLWYSAAGFTINALLVYRR
ncbi:MAG: GtrA family protein [Legionellaceae bacterium]|nr:GtrA family protein [Legionellaceae bacterium]MBP9774827.1 GtrA family protein [Legionellaceae bacterium]